MKSSVKSFKRKLKIGAAIATTLTVFASSAHAVNLVTINSSNEISIFDSANAAGAVFNTISGAGVGENFIGIDLRPSNNLVYGLTRSNKIYTIDAATGNSSFVASLGTSVIAANKGYGIDFNPVADRGTGASLRLVSSSGDNYAINANTGAVTIGSAVGGMFTAVSYTNSDATTPAVAPASTALYYIDSTTDTLSFATTGFNNPAITRVGSLDLGEGVDVLRANGFDISSDGIGYAALNFDDGQVKSGLFTVSLATGKATWVGNFNGTVNGLTVAPVPEPETYAMMLAGLGLLGYTSRRKKKQA